ARLPPGRLPHGRRQPLAGGRRGNDGPDDPVLRQPLGERPRPPGGAAAGAVERAGRPRSRCRRRPAAPGCLVPQRRPRRPGATGRIGPARGQTMRRAARPLFGPSLRGALVGALCGLAAWAVAQQPLLRGLEDWLQDASFAWRGARPSATKVVVVGIDDTTLAGLPKPLAALSPELAAVVTYLKGRGAAAIGLD